MEGALHIENRAIAADEAVLVAALRDLFGQARR